MLPALLTKLRMPRNFTKMARHFMRSFDLGHARLLSDGAYSGRVFTGRIRFLGRK